MLRLFSLLARGSKKTGFRKISPQRSVSTILANHSIGRVEKKRSFYTAIFQPSSIKLNYNKNIKMTLFRMNLSTSTDFMAKINLSNKFFKMMPVGPVLSGNYINSLDMYKKILYHSWGNDTPLNFTGKAAHIFFEIFLSCCALCIIVLGFLFNVYITFNIFLIFWELVIYWDNKIN